MALTTQSISQELSKLSVVQSTDMGEMKLKFISSLFFILIFANICKLETIFLCFETRSFQFSFIISLTGS